GSSRRRRRLGRGRRGISPWFGCRNLRRRRGRFAARGGASDKAALLTVKLAMLSAAVGALCVPRSSGGGLRATRKSAAGLPVAWPIASRHHGPTSDRFESSPSPAGL